METVQKFQGILNGVEYTDPKEFQEALKNVKNFSNYQMSQRFYTEQVEDEPEKMLVRSRPLQEELEEIFKDNFVINVDRELKHIVDSMLTNEELVQEVIDCNATLKHAKYNFDEFYKQLDGVGRDYIDVKIGEVSKQVREEIYQLDNEEYRLSRQLEDITNDIYNRLDSAREKFDYIFTNRYVKPRHDKHTTLSDYVSEYEDIYSEYAKVKIKQGLLRIVLDYYFNLI
jgi:hypothetical protein